LIGIERRKGMKVRISLNGCDDSTEFNMEDVTQEQYDFLQRIAEKSKETSTYGCMPTMDLELV
jgi:hypothetical protein